MLGAIVGDVIGSVHEFAGTKTKDFPLFVAGSTFTDDSVLTVAVADWLLSGQDLVDVLHAYYHAIFHARRSRDKDQIRRTLESQFGYDLSARLEQIRPTYRFDETCQGTVPQALAELLARAAAPS